MSGRVHFDIVAGPAELAAAAAAEAAEVLEAAVAARGSAVFVATGGGAPGPVYDRLSQADLPWDRITVTLSDERWVDPADPDSNEGMVRRRLLRGPAARARLVPLMGAGLDPAADAAAADAALGALPRPFDLVFLGMGEDAHIASLFPGSPALEQGFSGDALCIAVPPGGGGRAPPQARLSLTLTALKSARRIVLLFSGARKFDVLEAALNASDPHLFPVRALLGAPAGVHVICAS